MNKLARYALFLTIIGLSACGGGSNKSSSLSSSSSSNSSSANTSSSLIASVSSTTSSSSSVNSSSLGNSSASSIAPLFVIATGLVVDESGVPVSAASIAIEGSNILESTNVEGSFSVNLSTQTPAILRITKSGFASTIRAAATAGDNGVFAKRIVLHSVGATLNLESANDNTLRVPGSTARVDLPANSLATANGSIFAGAAKVTLTPIDPSVNVDFMPGVMVDGGSGIAIESMGALGVEFTDTNGQPLNLGANKTATIRIPATPPAGVTPPATMPLYHLNETTGLWEQDGTASLQTDPVSGEQYYQGEVSHFSWWNADQMITRAEIDYSETQSSTTCDYSALPGNVSLVMQGVDFISKQSLSPISKLPLYAKALGTARLTLVNADSILDSLDITMPAAGVTVKLPRCLVMPQQVTVSGKVTVSSGDLAAYRVQISGERFLTKTINIDSAGNYSASVYANAGAVTARLVGGIQSRETSTSSATVTVVNSSVAFSDLVIIDDKVTVTGCVSGWETYPHESAQLNVFEDGKFIESLADVTSQNRNFSFISTINQNISLVITPSGNNLHEKTVPVAVANINVNLSNCLALPKAPTAAVVASGSGFTRTFSASTSVAGDASIVKYEWSFSDGAIAEGQTVNHTFATFGSYFVSLKVTDALMQQASSGPIPVAVTDNTQTITVKPSLLSSGLLHSCSITAGGGVKCWGNNDAGQLGNGAFFNGVRMEDAVPITGLSDVVAVSAGGNHSCAITALGALKCWGENTNGQLGNGVGAFGLNSNVPVNVVGLNSGVIAVSLGRSHTCAIVTPGAIKCWGDNGSGQLGNGTNISSNTPVNVTGLETGAYKISAGNSHSCAAVSGTGAFCWGSNGSGSLGNGTDFDNKLPIAVTGLSGSIISLASGYKHSCAVTSAGRVKCWGYNLQGQLGIGTTTDSPVPVQIASLSDIVLVSLGEGHSCALNSAGYTSCWGVNTYNQLGNETDSWFTPDPTSANVQEGTAEAISVGGYNTCALKADGSVQCWGWDGLYMPGG
ncbi:MAG: PKD domain-containing protein [Gammaproteobacteria bacterium]|nr:MAG: PKD domain-containing protein [Gammaproteobacteria bacterium]